MNTIPLMQSLPVASPATGVEHLHLPSLPFAIVPRSGGFPDAAAAQRHADRAAAARLTYEARLERERKLRDRLLHQVVIARSEGRAEGSTHALAQRQVGFLSGLRWGLAFGFPIGGVFFAAVVWIGMHWTGLA
jgi:hypothetical protein